MINVRRPSRGAATRAAVLVVAALAALSTTLLTAPPATAHAVLVTSSPPDGARLDRAPARVELTFDESVRLVAGTAQVISTDGVRVDTGDATLSPDGTTILIPLKPNIASASYAVTWRVVSADTHIVAGSIRFGVGQAPSAGPVAVPDHTGPLDFTANVAQGLLFAGIVLCLGVLAVCHGLWRRVLGFPRVRVIVAVGWLLLFAATAAQLFLAGPRADNVSWSGAAHLDGLRQTVVSAAGVMLLFRAGLLLVAAPFVWTLAGTFPRRPRTTAVLGAVAGVGLVVTVVVPGHEAVGSYVWLAAASGVAHVCAMSIWFGGLITLSAVIFPAVRRGSHDLAQDLTAWSYTAFGCVSILVLTGEYMALRQVVPIAALWSTRYGVTLLIKLAVVGVLLASAATAQRQVMRRRVDGSGSSPLLGRTVVVEAALGLLVLAVTTALVAEPPARTTYGPSVQLSAPLGADHTILEVNTTRRGRQILDVQVVDGAGKPVTVDSVKATMSSADAHIAALKVDMAQVPGDGTRWRSSDATAPLPGVWSVQLTVALSRTDAYVTSAQYRVW